MAIAARLRPPPGFARSAALSSVASASAAGKSVPASAPEGLPELTVQMGRPDPFNPHDGLGDGSIVVHPDGLVDKIYNLWNRNPVTVSRRYTATRGAQDKPRISNLRSY